MLSDAVGSPKHPISELNTQPADTPVQRFKCSITAALTWLGARVVRYSFPVRLFHSLLYAGLSRRYPDIAVLKALLASSATEWVYVFRPDGKWYVTKLPKTGK